GGRCRSMAAEVLGEMGEAAREAIPVLGDCLEDASPSAEWIHLEAAVALWRIEHRVDRALPVLIGLLEDPGPAGLNIAKRAAVALGEMGAEAREAVPLLRRATAGDVRSAGSLFHAPGQAVIEDDAYLSTIAEALRRIEGDHRV